MKYSNPNPNGWWPRLHAVGDRIFQTYGNGQCWIAEYRLTPAGWDRIREWSPAVGPARTWAGFWIRPGVCTFYQEQTDTTARRWEVDVTADTWVPRLMDDDPAAVAGNQFQADGGHWASWLVTNPTRTVLDGQQLLTGAGAMRLAGDWLACGNVYPDAMTRILTYYKGKPGPAYLVLTPTNQLAIGPDGRLIYGWEADLLAIDPMGAQARITCTPWRYEPVGQIVLDPSGTPWIVTITWHEGTAWGAVLLRPWGSTFPTKAALVVEAGAVHVSVLPFGDQWLVATCGDRGQGLLQAVPRATPLQILNPRVAPVGQKYLGYYYAAGRYGDFQPKQNVTVLALSNFADGAGSLPTDAKRRMQAAAEQAGAIIIGNSAGDIDTMATRWPLVHGLMLGEHATVDGIDAEADQARQQVAAKGLPARAIVATITPDQVLQNGWRLPKVDALAVEIYFDLPAGSWADQVKATNRRIDAVLARTGNLPVIFIVQCFDRNGVAAWQTPDGRTCLEAITSTCLDRVKDPNVLGCWWFAYARIGGVLAYPELEKWHQAAVDGGVRPAGIPITAHPEQPPAVTIISYDPKTGEAPLTVTALAKVTAGQVDTLTWRWRPVGAAAWTVAAVNPVADLDHHYTFDAEGDYEISLQGKGPAGTAETGLQRRVTVTRKVDPVDPVHEFVPTRIVTWNGGCLVAEDGGGDEGQVIAGRPAGLVTARGKDTDPPPWQYFEVVKGAQPGTVGFRSSGNRWLSAQPDGTLVCNRERPDGWKPEAWEAFKISDMGDGWAALQSDHGLFIRCEGGGGSTVKADAADAGVWESFKFDPPLTASVPGGDLDTRQGIVRASGHVLVDDGGPFLAIGTTLFPIGWLFKFDRDRLRANLAKLKGRVHYVRGLAVVGPGGGWEDRTVDPRWPDFQNVIAGATDLAYDEFGIRIAWTVFGGIDLAPKREDRDRIVQQVGAVIAARAHKVISIEVMNEAWQNGFGDKRDEAKAHCRTLRQLTPCLVSVTAPAGQPSDEAMTQEVRSWYDGANATQTPAHFSRDTNGTGGLWRPERQPWELQFWGGAPPALWHDQEPIGPRSSVAMDDDPERLAIQAAAAWICGCAMKLLHTGAGVRMGGAADQGSGKFYLPREANLFDVPNLDPILDGINFMHGLLPADTPNGARQNSNDRFPDHPFDYREIGEDKVLRVYATNLGDRFAAVCIKVITTIKLKAKRPMHLRVYSFDGAAKTWGLAIEQDLAAGEFVTVTGPASGAGHVVVGNYR